MAHHVFISHASEDFSLAESICCALELAGIRCWLSPRDLIPGVQYAEALIHADCIAESLASFRRVGRRDRNVTTLDLFVDIAKHGHGPSVRQLRQHGVDSRKIDEEVRALGVETLRPR